jgi:hypothetical protein
LNYLENLQLGTQGWLHADWCGSFYPEDMPHEWQFEYYANLYHTVLVPEAQWRTWQGSAAADMMAELGVASNSGFRFYLAVDSALSEEKTSLINGLAATFNHLLAGIVVLSDGQLPPLEFVCDNARLPVTLVSSTLQQPGWSWTYDGLTVSGAPLGFVARLPADGKAQAQLLKTFKASLPPEHTGAVLFVQGESLNMAHLANLKTVSEFLGY